MEPGAQVSVKRGPQSPYMERREVAVVVNVQTRMGELSALVEFADGTTHRVPARALRAVQS